MKNFYWELEYQQSKLLNPDRKNNRRNTKQRHTQYIKLKDGRTRVIFHKYGK